jgi:hypothetical protein
MSDAHMKVLMLALRMARCDADTPEALDALSGLVEMLATEFAYIDADFDRDVFYNCVIRGSNVDGTDFVW